MKASATSIGVKGNLSPEDRAVISKWSGVPIEPEGKFTLMLGTKDRERYVHLLEMLGHVIKSA